MPYSVSTAPASMLGTMDRDEDIYNGQEVVGTLTDDDEFKVELDEYVFLELSQMVSRLEDDIDNDMNGDESTAELDDDMSYALSRIASSLCTTCRKFPPRGRFLLKHKRVSDALPYHRSLSSLRGSVDTGCRLCSNVWQSLEDFCNKSEPPVTQNEFWSIRCQLVCLDEFLRLKFHLCKCEPAHPVGASCEHFESLLQMDFYPARKLGPGPEFLGKPTVKIHHLQLCTCAHLSAPDPTLKASSAKSATSFAVARSWYQQCLNHATCRNWRQESRILPTRLIEIWRPDDQSSDLAAKICETADLSINTPYVTLSHCWGKVVIFKLLQNNLQDLSQAIPISQLPKVFQDAMYVSFELGIRYLWIDSLCIIQDSKEDWAHQSKLMGEVYANGELNIAATGYEDGLSGLFSERKAFPRKYIVLCLDCVLVDEENEKESAFEGHYFRVDEDELLHQVNFGPLNDRAWVAQERTLSRAIIHYTQEQMWWECNETIASEAFTKGFSTDLQIWASTEGSGQERIRSLSKQSDRNDIYSFWRTFISTYARMAMTFHEDRFAAVAGIARLLGELIDDNFVAGFWEGDLLPSLLLERMVYTSRNVLPIQIGPSWSWMSFCAGTVLTCYDGSRLEPLNGVHIKVLSEIPGFKSDLQLPSFEKSGVRGLAIKGALRKILDDSEKQSEWFQSVAMCYDNRKPVKFRRDIIPQEQAWRLNDPTHMLFLARERVGDSVHAYGLLVQSAEMNEANAFRRSGTVELWFDSGEKCDEYLGLQEGDGESSSCIPDRGLQDLVLL